MSRAELLQAPSSRDKILNVAEALFARSGFNGVGMQEVATKVGLGKSSLFHHFASKESLYFLVLERAVRRIADHLGGVFSSHSSPTHRLDALSDGLVDSLAEQPHSARLLLRSLFEDTPIVGGDPSDEALAADLILATLIESFQALIREGIDCGEFREVSVVDATQTMVGAAFFYFASGEFGEAVLGSSLFTAEAVARRRIEQRDFFHHALVRVPRSSDSD